MPHIDLLDLAPFADIPMGDVVSLIDVMAPQQWQPGGQVITQGELQAELLVITAGSIACTSPAKAREILRAPLVLPVHPFFSQGPAPFAVEAHTLVSAFCLDRETFERLLVTGHPALARFLTNLLALGEGLHACKGLR